MTFFLLLTSLIFLASGIYFARKSDSVLTRTSKTILFTASGIYFLMAVLMFYVPNISLRPWRYLDWFITVPLLLIELYEFASNRSRKNIIIMVVASLIMLLLGLLGELTYIDKLWANGIGFLFGVLIFYILFKNINARHLEFLKSITLLWCFYPIAYLVNDNLLTIVLFSVVDLLAKVGSAFYIEYQQKYI